MMAKVANVFYTAVGNDSDVKITKCEFFFMPVISILHGNVVI